MKKASLKSLTPRFEHEKKFISMRNPELRGEEVQTNHLTKVLIKEKEKRLKAHFKIINNCWNFGISIEFL